MFQTLKVHAIYFSINKIISLQLHPSQKLINMSQTTAVPQMPADVMAPDTLTSTTEAINTANTVDNMTTDTATKDMSEPVPQKEPEPEQTVFDCDDNDTKLSVTNDIRTATEALTNLKKKLVEVKKRDAYLKKHKSVGDKPARGVKKPKKTRAPGTKRRALSPYICFVKTLSAGPDRVPFAEIGSKWKAMSDEEKAPFVKLSKDDDLLAEEEAANERTALETTTTTE
ncbi:hypothetical protein EPVG_00291 [Emiliania huxleyi virus 201]|nr:hypothetical protein ELVG_00273 [Emiliania huxleyi virus 203]AEP15696.1 hypothetical protein EQVG_00286 [Emiliania huxleyi virus 207]AEP16272.1 hypothetical protein ERVG_00399 [Emiliania huxleyi virus 208]AET98178.1 hypothetical protein EPVG_00291 [Emiliania huxleyi virus 201]